MSTNQRNIDRVLSGEACTTHTDSEQAIARSAWEDRTSASLSALNLGEEFQACGRAWSEADDEGNLVKHRADRAGFATDWTAHWPSWAPTEP